MPNIVCPACGIFLSCDRFGCLKLYEMSCDFYFVFEQRDHVCKREKTVHFAVDRDKRVSFENFCGLILLHKSACFDFEVFGKSLVGALICFSCNVYFKPTDIKSVFASNGQIVTPSIVIACGTIILFEFLQFLANFIKLNYFSFEALIVLVISR